MFRSSEVSFSNFSLQQKELEICRFFKIFFQWKLRLSFQEVELVEKYYYQEINSNSGGADNTVILCAS